jgi:hypothetical protein
LWYVIFSLYFATVFFFALWVPCCLKLNNMSMSSMNMSDVESDVSDVSIKILLPTLKNKIIYLFF